MSEHDSARPDLARAVAVGLLGASLALVLSMTMRTPLKDDVAWLIYVARKWMGGQQLYVDLVEVNPPLIIWLSAIPAQLGVWLGVTGRVVAMPFFAAMILAAAWWSAGLLRGLDPLYKDRITVFAVIASILLLVAGNELGQREHLLIAIALPYLCVTALSLRGQTPGPWTSLAAGALAALGCALKPRYGLAFAAVELLALSRGLRPWRWVNVGAVAIALLYGWAILAFHPAYLDRAVPLALALYGASDATFAHLLRESIFMLAGVGALLVVVAAAVLGRRPERWPLMVLAIFAVISVLVCFMDRKDWFYHRLPATIAAVLGLVLWLAGTLAARRDGLTFSWPLRTSRIAAGVAMLLLMFAAGQRALPRLVLAVDPDVSTEARLERILKKEKARSYVAFSEWIALGFPVVNNTDVTWASRFDSMWALNGELWRARFDPKTARDWPVRRWVVRDFIAGCPDVVVVDMRSAPNYIGVLATADFAFARAWSNYAQIAAFDGLRVYRRQSPDCTSFYAGDTPGMTAGLR